jgi:hypothetical protein
VSGSIHSDPALSNAFAAVTLDNPSLISTLTSFTPTSHASPVVGAGLDLTQTPYSIGGIVNSINGRPAGQGGVYDIGAAKFIQSVTAATALQALMSEESVCV